MKKVIIALALMSSSAFALGGPKGQACQDARQAVIRNGFQDIAGTLFYGDASATNCAGWQVVQQGWIGSCPVGYICVDKDALSGLTSN